MQSRYYDEYQIRKERRRKKFFDWFRWGAVADPGFPGRIRYDMIRYDIWYDTMRCDAMRCDAIWYDMIRYDKIRFPPINDMRYEIKCTNEKMSWEIILSQEIGLVLSQKVLLIYVQWYSKKLCRITVQISLQFIVHF